MAKNLIRVAHQEAIWRVNFAKEILVQGGRSLGSYESPEAWARDVSSLAVAIAGQKAWEDEARNHHWDRSKVKAEDIKEAILFACNRQEPTPVALYIRFGKKKPNPRKFVAHVSDPNDEDELNKAIIDALIAYKILDNLLRREYFVEWKNQDEGSIRLADPEGEYQVVLSFTACYC